ncbi:hypothetical protein, partial [uncultured Thiodictyon sp.]|uniref:hypothetical protein n=1 Tax=uncultured Thiodictyon sp. TaxID=1846217 RepID=UPI0025FD2294
MTNRVGIDIGANFDGMVQAGRLAAEQLKQAFSHIGGGAAGGAGAGGSGSGAAGAPGPGSVQSVDALQKALARANLQFRDTARHTRDIQINLQRLADNPWIKELRRRAVASWQNFNDPLGLNFSRLGSTPRAGGLVQARLERELLRDTRPPPSPSLFRRIFPGSPPPEHVPPPGQSDGGAGAAGGGAAAPPGGGIGGAARWAGRKAWGGAKSMLAIAGVGSAIGAVATGFRESVRSSESIGSIYKSLTSGAGFGDLRKDVEGLGQSLQLATADAAELAEHFVRTSGAVDSQAVDRAGVAGQFGRGYGLDPGTSASLFGRAEAVGYGGGSKSQRDFAALLGQTISRSGMFAKSEQVMTDMVGAISGIANKELRPAGEGEMGKIGDMLSVLYSNKALRDGGATSVLDAFGKAGSGGAGPAEGMAYLAFGGAVGYDPANMEIMKEAGLGASPKSLGLGSDTRTKAELLFGAYAGVAEGMPGADLRRQFGYTMNKLGGTTSAQGGAIWDLMTDPALHSDGRSFGGFAQWMEKATGGGLERVKPGGIASLSRLYTGQADVHAMAEQYRTAPGVDAEMKGQLGAAIQSGDTSNIMAVLPKVIAMAENQGTEEDLNRQATADLAAGLTSLGDLLAPLINTLKSFDGGVLGKIAGSLETIAGYMGRVFGAGAGVVKTTAGYLGRVFGDAPSPPGAGVVERVANGAARGSHLGVLGGAAGALHGALHGARDGAAPGGVESQRPDPGTDAWRAWVGELEKSAGLPPGLMVGTEYGETGHITDRGKRAAAVSPAGAQGWWQLMPANSAKFGVNPLDPHEGALGAMRLHQANKQALEQQGITPDIEHLAAMYQSGRPTGGTADYLKKVLLRSNTGADRAPLSAVPNLGDGGGEKSPLSALAERAGITFKGGKFDPNGPLLGMVDPSMKSAVALGALANPDLAVDVTSGYRSNSLNHRGGYALDVQLRNRSTGKEYINYGAHGATPQDARAYEKFWQDATALQKARDPAFNPRWGGYYVGGKDPADFMHGDVTPGGAAAGGDLVTGATPEWNARWGGFSQGMIGGSTATHRRALLEANPSLRKFIGGGGDAAPTAGAPALGGPPPAADGAPALGGPPPAADGAPALGGPPPAADGA